MYTSLSWFSDQTKDVTPRVLVLGHSALHKPLFYIFWTYISTTMISVIFWYHGLIYCLELCFLTPYCDIKPFGSSTLSVFPVWQPAGFQADNISPSLQTLILPCKLSIWQPDKYGGECHLVSTLHGNGSSTIWITLPPEMFSESVPQFNYAGCRLHTSPPGWIKVNLVAPVAVKFVWMLQGDWLCPCQREPAVRCWTNILTRFAPSLIFGAH